MSRSTPPTTAMSRIFGGTKAATPHDTSGLFHTLQGHVDEIRGLLQCGICIRPLYEPFTLACGHTFCYGCLGSWFAEGRSNKTCPDCRAPVKTQPAPAYLVRAVVQLFTSRAELLDKGETTDQHRTHSFEEAQKVETDKKNTDLKDGGLFRGIFNKGHHPSHPIYDLEDGVVRCPQCSWELDEAGCVNCGYRHDDDSMSDTDWRSDSEENSVMTDDPYDDVDVDVDVDLDEDVDDGFARAPAFDLSEWYDRVPLEALPPELRYNPMIGFGRNGFGIMPGTAVLHHHLEFGSHDSTHDDDDDDNDEDDEDDEEDDEEMDSFIDDGEPSENHASDSDRSTIVGHPEYSREQLHAILNESPGQGYNTTHSNVYDFNAIPDSEDEEDNISLDADSQDDDSQDDADSHGLDDDNEDSDEDEEPVRPAVAGSRRIPTYHILSSSSPLRVNGETGRNLGSNGATSGARWRGQPPSVGASATSAITVDDDSDEGPVGPTRRARDRGNCRTAAL
ncbi:hypothetical protein BDW59DRAFT_156929 [Aspergillus cavernicola]|uniref:RING-type domain-containing protein n=1 Tax=Aspergillus cavernicola TaxID=176166 RepID=A0ABR4J0B4_9EURO